MPKIPDDGSALALAMRTNVMAGLPPATDLTDLKIIEVRYPLTDSNARQPVFRIAVANDRVVAVQHGTYTARRDTWGSWEAYFGLTQRGLRGLNEAPLVPMPNTLRKILNRARPTLPQEAKAVSAVVREAQQSWNDWRTRDTAA